LLCRPPRPSLFPYTTLFRSFRPGYPIRTSSDHSSVGSSPRLIAASHVLHRPLVPRHPPCALHTLTTKMLAPTIQFSNNNPASKHTHSVFPHNPTASSPARSEERRVGKESKSRRSHSRSREDRR